MLKDVQGLSNRLPIIDITKDKHFKPFNQVFIKLVENT